MTIVFYDQQNNQLWICNKQTTTVVSLNDEQIGQHIPNDDILYVTNAHYFTKDQFIDFLSGKLTINNPQDDVLVQSVDHPNPTVTMPMSNKKFIHSTGNGVVLIEDIITSRFPAGIMLQGKWHFVSVDDIGEAELANSVFFDRLLKIKKVEIVNGDYVRQNAHKLKDKRSPAEAALDRILIPSGRSGTAQRVADAGGIESSKDNDNNIAVPIYVE